MTERGALCTKRRPPGALLQARAAEVRAGEVAAGVAEHELRRNAFTERQSVELGLLDADATRRDRIAPVALDERLREHELVELTAVRELERIEL
ncbi:MAG: hypothetical protein ACLQBY_15915 [Solirubrobacteraceae bacterium]